VDGMIKAYNKALKDVELSAPTYFSKILEKAITIAKDD